MSKKSHPFNKLSDRECEVSGCRKMLKKRLVEDIDAKRCYKHNLAGKKAKQKKDSR